MPLRLAARPLAMLAPALASRSLGALATLVLALRRLTAQWNGNPRRILRLGLRSAPPAAARLRLRRPAPGGSAHRAPRWAAQELDGKDMTMKVSNVLRNLKNALLGSQDEAPIQNLHSVDILARLKDGGVDLGIVASGPLTDRPEIQRLLRDKVEAYLGYINSDEFKDEFDNPSPEKTVIVVVCCASVDPVIVELVERMKPWVEDNNARIRLEMSHSEQVCVETPEGNIVASKLEVDPFPQETSVVTGEELEHLESLGKASPGFVATYLPNESVINLQNCDRAFRAWQTSESKQHSNERVIEILGGYLGSKCVDELNMEWVIVTDQFGTDYAVRSKTSASDSEVMLFPFSTVKKRIEKGEFDFLHNVYHTTERTLESQDLSAHRQSGSR
jgi:hypothetical protein